MVTVYDVAKAAGTSIASVSRAMSGQPGVSVTTAARIRKIAGELGYQPNDVARSLALNSTRMIALLLPRVTNPFFPELVSGVQAEADAVDHALLLSDSSGNPEKQAAAVNMLKQKQVDGVIVVAGAFGPALEMSMFNDIPTVFLGGVVPVGEHSTVTVDHEEGAYLAVRHLVELGHRRIAHVAGPAGRDVPELRVAGWRRACREGGCAVDEDLLVRGDFLETGGYAAGGPLLDRAEPPTAVFAANDLTAIGFRAACADRGLSVPGDVSIVGFDGIQLARYTTPKLTTVAQPIYKLGTHAGRLLLETIRAGGPLDRHEILPVELQVGGSTAVLGVRT